MAKSVAIILDGGFVLKKVPQPNVTERDIYNFALGCIDHTSEELFRIFFYHCSPYEKTETNPISHQPVDFGASLPAQRNKQLLAKLAETRCMAFEQKYCRTQDRIIT